MTSVHHEYGVRQSADWMKPPDDRILEEFSDEGNLAPVAMSREGRVDRVDISRKYAGERCRELTSYGLLEYVDDGLFRITDQGKGYLDEELDASKLEPTDEAE